MSDMHIYDVIIIGAGPVGLATAIGLRQRGIENILVLDQTRIFRKVGQSVDILPNGLKALKFIDKQAYEAVIKSSVNITQPNNSDQASPKWFFRDLQGKAIRSVELNFNHWLENYGEGRVSISWFDLQTSLRNLLPQAQVKPNHRCINVVTEQGNEWVRVDCLSDTTVGANPYAHWDSQQQVPQTEHESINTSIDKSAQTSFYGKLIVAADGINSTVRKLLYKDTPYQAFSSPEYSGYAAILGSEIIDLANQIKTEIQENFLYNLPSVIITEDGKLRDDADELTPKMILVNRPPGQFRYIIHIPVEKNKLEENYLIELTLEKLANNNFPNCIQELVRKSKPENMKHRTYHIHRATISNYLPFPTTANFLTGDNYADIKPPWHDGRVVLVGDAAHGMPPFEAQGVNQGLEDALTIAELISKIAILDKFNDIKAIQEAFEKYENSRRPLMEYVQKATMTGLSYSTNKEQLDKYNQKVFARDFEEVIEALK